MAGELRWKDCYVGQPVFWVMWIDQKHADEAAAKGSGYAGYYRYKAGLSPELWGDVVDKVAKNGRVVLRQHGKAHDIYRCEIDAVRGACDIFCDELGIHVLYPKRRVRVPLGEFARVINLLAELEDGCHVAKAALDTRKAQHGR